MQTKFAQNKFWITIVNFISSHIFICSAKNDANKKGQLESYPHFYIKTFKNLTSLLFLTLFSLFCYACLPTIVVDNFEFISVSAINSLGRKHYCRNAYSST